MNNKAWRNIQLNVIILYNAHLKANEVMDDWNIETIKDLYLHYLNYQRSLLSVVIKYYYKSIIQ